MAFVNRNLTAKVGSSEDQRSFHFFLLLNKRKCLCGAKFQASVACELASSLYLFVTMSFLPKLLLPLEDYTKLRLSLIYILYMLPLRCFYATFLQLMPMKAPA